MRHRMSTVFIALSMLSCTAIAVHAQVSMRVSLPGIEIGINMPMYPTLVQVPDYPVYCAEQANMVRPNSMALRMASRSRSKVRSRLGEIAQ